jgi:hypothetical protein
MSPLVSTAGPTRYVPMRHSGGANRWARMLRASLYRGASSLVRGRAVAFRRPIYQAVDIAAASEHGVAPEARHEGAAAHALDSSSYPSVRAARL